MATYLQGVTDAVTTLNPPDPGLQFNMQLLQMRQSKYDQAHSKLSKMYGTILNSGLTRDDNIAARDEFFKLVQGDLQKIAGMDLSLDSNVSKAQGVFKQFYTNNYLVKDMVWTKNYQSQQKRADAFKNCTDDAKCGGQYWEDGEKFMQYKRQEFKNMSADESLYAEDVQYIPYNNMMEKALKDLKEMGGFNMTQDTQNGDYQYTTKNGELVKQPMLLMFDQLYKDNPQFHDMYKVMAYNQRNDWMYSKIQDGTYKNLNEASVGYIKEFRNDHEKRFNERSANISHDREDLELRIKAFEDDIKNNRDVNEDEYKETQILYANALALEKYNDIYKSAQKNMHSQQSLSNLSDYLDNVTATNLFDEDLNKTVDALKWKDYEQTFKLEEKAKMRIQHQYDVAMENLKFEHNKELEIIKGQIKAEIEGAKFNPAAFETYQTYQSNVQKVDDFEIFSETLAEVRKKQGNDYQSNLDIQSVVNNPKYKTESQKYDAILKLINNSSDKGTFEAAYKAQKGSRETLKRNVNKSALDYIEQSIKYGGISNVPELYGDVLTEDDKNQIRKYADDHPNIEVLQELNETYGKPKANVINNVVNNAVAPVGNLFMNATGSWMNAGNNSNFP